MRTVSGKVVMVGTTDTYRYVKRLVPIHSVASSRFGEFFENVEVHRDQEWRNV
jgi:hypothetical protein